MQTTDIGIEVCSLDRVPPRIGVMLRLLQSKPLRSAFRALVTDPFAPSPRKLFGALGRALQIYQQGVNATHIHAHFLGTPAIAAFCLSRMTGRTYSITAHARDIYAAQTPRAVVANAFPRFTCTEEGRQYLTNKYHGCPFELIRHGVNISFPDRRTRPMRNPQCRLLAVGRLVEKKGFNYLIEACHLLSRAGFKYSCTIIGEGPERRALERLINAGGLNGNVVMPGSMPHEDVLRHIAEADIFVAPSIVARDGDRDGVPNTILEAMALQLPVVATDAGAIPELVKDRMNGLLVRSKKPQEIAEACMLLWQDQELSARLAAEANSFVIKYFDSASWNALLLASFHNFFGQWSPCSAEGCRPCQSSCVTGRKTDNA